MTRIGACLSRIDERIPGSNLPLMSVSQTRGVIRRTELTDKPPRAESLDVYKICRTGDIVFNKMSIRAGALGVAAEDGLVTYHYEVMRPLPNADGRFIVYLMKSPVFIGELVARERGIGSGDQTNVRTTEVPFSVLKTIDVSLPTVEGQHAIADFLDAETAKIDALIAKQEQLIATLREDRTATITHAVTKGLDPRARSLASGDQWLGEVVEHWTRARIRDVVSFIESGVSVNGTDEPADLEVGEIGVLKTSCVSAGYFNPQANKTVFVEEVSRVACPVQKGQIVVNRANTPDLVGSAGYVAESVEGLYLSDLLWALKPSGIDPQFLYLWMQTPVYRTQVAAWRVGTSASMQKISKASLRAFVIAIPPAQEQRHIIDFVYRRTAGIDSLIAKSRAVVAVLREYRAALITDAVTGKIDVRGAVA